VNVTTHKGAEGRAVDLCIDHGQKATALLYLGADYFGVSHGLHAGTCAECERRAVEPAEALDVEGARTVTRSSSPRRRSRESQPRTRPRNRAGNATKISTVRKP